MSKLKLCPFCGGEAEVIGYFQKGVANNYQYFVRCQKCKARPQLYGYTFTSKEKAIEAWNRRYSVDESPTIDVVEVVRCKDTTKIIHAHWLTWEEMFPDSKPKRKKQSWSILLGLPFKS